MSIGIIKHNYNQNVNILDNRLSKKYNNNINNNVQWFLLL